MVESGIGMTKTNLIDNVGTVASLVTNCLRRLLRLVQTSLQWGSVGLVFILPSGGDGDRDDQAQ